MKAIEFVKKFGWDEVISELSKTQDSVVVMWLGSQSNDYALVKDLKRLVESHELVESYGGLENAKDEYFSCVQNNEPASYIAKAILEVESCNE